MFKMKDEMSKEWERIKGSIFYVNGEYVSEERATVSVWDHGFMYGDGVFETLRAQNGKIFMLEKHMDRLYDSAKQLDIQIPLTKEEFMKVVIETVKRNHIKNAFVRPQVSRGKGLLGHDPRHCMGEKPTVVVYCLPLPLEYEKTTTATAIISSVRRTPAFCVPPTCKATQYLNNILAKIQANAAGAGQAIMLDHMGFVCEATGANIFMAKDGVLFTPPPSASILMGVTRKCCIEIAKDLGIPFQERDILPPELHSADEVFLSSTSAVTPIVKIDGRIIGDGKIGSITKRVIEKYAEKL